MRILQTTTHQQMLRYRSTHLPRLITRQPMDIVINSMIDMNQFQMGNTVREKKWGPWNLRIREIVYAWNRLGLLQNGQIVDIHILI